MKYLLDTCVISEIIKPKPNKKVLTWLKKQDEDSLFISVLSFGEIEKGIEKSANEKRQKKLRLWIEDDLKKRLEGRILSIDLQVSSN